jgi:C-terminal processing protease CtpA/Prc
LLDENYENTPTGNFDAVWNEFDQDYGAFEAKHINWDSIRLVYRSGLNDNSSKQELFSAIAGMISNLNDGHVQLIAPGFRKAFSMPVRTLYPDSKYYEKSNIIVALLNLIKSNYLVSYSDSNGFFYGNIKTRIVPLNIGYIYINSFVRDVFPMDFIDKGLKSFENCNAIIVDLRFNGGGATETFLSLLNRFADTKRLYLKSKLRNGVKHNDFTNIYEHYTWPEKGLVKNKKVVVIVNRFSGSSSEHFMLGMKTFPFVTVVGDTTYGALSTVIEKVMPNGWEYRMCPQVLLDTTGNYLADSKGRYPDGVGLAPDVYVVNYYNDILRQHDYVLEKAIEILR